MPTFADFPRHIPGRATAVVALLLVAAAGCASGGGADRAPIYDLRATEAPRRYSMEGSSLTVIELPSGDEQRVEPSTTATLSVAFGAPTDAGIPFEMTIEEIDVAGAAGSADLSGLTGQPIRGTAQADGTIEVTEAPELDVPGFDPSGLGQMINPLIVPLPPGGDPTAESWPLQVTRSTGDVMVGQASFDGTVRFTPAEDWNGTPARVIVSSGDVRQRASGTPPGAPGEVDMEAEGTSETTYVWDPAAGVLLHVEREATLDGTISLSAQGMTLPTTISSSESYTRLTP